MRGPNSSCFFTCSMARSPLKATAPGTTGLSRFSLVVATLTAGGLSSFGQAVSNSPATRRLAAAQILRNWIHTEFLFALCISSASYTVCRLKRKNTSTRSVGFSLECGDLSPLWSAATCRSQRRSEVKVPPEKGSTSRDTGIAPARAWAFFLNRWRIWLDAINRLLNSTLAATSRSRPKRWQVPALQGESHSYLCW